MVGVGVAAAAIGIFFAVTHEKAKPAGEGAAAKAVEQQTPVTKDREQRHDREAPTGTSNGPPDVALQYDDDPDGKIRLEGQVVDADDKPVAGAIVGISANPARQVKTEGDGSFAFDKLLAREYTLEARQGDAAGGPVTVRVNGKTEPVIIHLAQASSLELTVLDATTKAPVAGADVKTTGDTPQSTQTGADGKATLRGLSSWSGVVVSAAGYAPSSEVYPISGKAGEVERQTVLLVGGAAVSGRVVDDAGKPVANARVTPESASKIFEVVTRDDMVTTDAKGAWRIAALPAGTYRFGASHEKLAPGSSEAVKLDGRSEVKDVTITLAAGAHIAGKVVSRQGTAVPGAAVRVAVKSGGYRTSITRQVYCDDQGAFDVQGLPRAPVSAIALHDSGASSTIELDLASKPEQLGLTITLDVDGQIAGVVVDARGQPLPGAQVSGVPEVTGNEQDLSRWTLRGFASDVTDAGGRFTLTGLEKGPYRLRAGRTTGGDATRSADFWSTTGTLASAGDTNVKIVLEDEASIRGKVLYPDGSAPEVFSVATTTYGASIPFSGKDGAFTLEHVSPGMRALTIDGPGFTRKITDAYEVKPGAATDVGTITVEKGRAIRGKVVRGDGTPVAQAKVMAGGRLIGDGAGVASNAAIASSLGIHSAETQDDGTFVIHGAGLRNTLVVADHATEGRSVVTPIGPGTDDVIVTLTLQPPGSLEGKVTSKGGPVDGALIIAQPQGAARGQFIVNGGPDGTFRFDKLSPDHYAVSAARQGGIGGGSEKTEIVEVVSGQSAHVAIDLAATGIVVSVGATFAGGGEPDNALVFLVSGAIHPTNVEELESAIPARGAGAVFQGLIIKGGAKTATFKDVEPGAYSACASPIMGNIMDAAVQQRLQKDVDTLIVGCQAVTVTSAQTGQTFTVVVPQP